jgi:hypothetical protein
MKLKFPLKGVQLGIWYSATKVLAPGTNKLYVLG